MISLNQGKKFQSYQKQIVNSVENKLKSNKKQEGFENIYDSVEDGESHENPQNSAFQRSLDQIQEEQDQYNQLLTKYTRLVNDFSGSTVPSSKNPYLGKMLTLHGIDSSGAEMRKTGYVTQQGLFKLFSDANTIASTSGRHGCPSMSDAISVNFDFSMNAIGSKGSALHPDASYNLTIGTPMVSGQSCGFEGTNVSTTWNNVGYVNEDAVLSHYPVKSFTNKGKSL